MPVALNNSGILFNNGTTQVTAVPSGSIVVWSGSAGAIPTGWLLCDGTNGTPDLRNRFIVGAGNLYGVGATGGSADAIVVSHTHTATVTDPGHNHAYQFLSSAPIRAGSNGPVPANSYSATTGSSATGISVSISTEGGSATNANLPPYYALCYIMKP
jgi:microcystin-dependent protein